MNSFSVPKTSGYLRVWLLFVVQPQRYCYLQWSCGLCSRHLLLIWYLLWHCLYYLLSLVATMLTEMFNSLSTMLSLQNINILYRYLKAHCRFSVRISKLWLAPSAVLPQCIKQASLLGSILWDRVFQKFTTVLCHLLSLICFWLIQNVNVSPWTVLANY